MVIEYFVMLIIAGIASLASLFTIAYYLPKMRESVRAKKEADDIVKEILGELHGRLGQQDQRILDQQVKLDTFELRLNEVKSFMSSGEVKEGTKLRETTPVNKTLEEVRNLLKSLGMQKAPIFKEPRVFPPTRMVKELSPTEAQILKLLSEGAKTPRQIEQVIKKSREHTARLLKTLYDSGYVTRTDVMKPYVYEVTAKGREFLGKEA